MISKIGAVIMLCVAAVFFATPANVFAASSTKSQVAKLNKQLKKLPKAGATFAQVKKLLTQLAKLDPAKAAIYYKTAISKLEPANADANASKLSKTTVSIVKKSGLPTGKLTSIVKKIEKTDGGFVPPTPTPAPYQAMNAAIGAAVA
jgi:hypothetical protein